MTLRLPCAIVESPWRHRHVPFVNIASLRSRSIKRRQWKRKLDYYGVVFAQLATGCGIKAKDPSGLDSDRWILHSRCCENRARAKALAGFSRHLSAGFADLNPAPRGLSLFNLARFDLNKDFCLKLFTNRECHYFSHSICSFYQVYFHLNNYSIKLLNWLLSMITKSLFGTSPSNHGPRDVIMQQ